MLQVNILKLYLWLLGTFTLFWWPLSHWLYPDWYHRLFGFASYDDAPVKVIGTIGIVPVLGMFCTAAQPLRNRDFVLVLLVFSLAMPLTYVYLIHYRTFPEREYVNVALLLVNAAVLMFLYPWKLAVSHIKPGCSTNG